MNLQDMLGTSDQSKSDSKVLESQELVIRGNGIVFNNTVMQISNITQIWAGSIDKKPLALSHVIGGILASLVLFFAGIAFDGLGFLIVISLIVMGFVLYVLWEHKSQVQKYAVNIELSSSRRYAFTSPQRDFIYKAFNVLCSIIVDVGSNTGVYSLNFHDGTFNIGNETVINRAVNSEIEVGRRH